MPIIAVEIATALVGREQRGDRLVETQLLELQGWSSDGRPGRACLIFSPAVEPARTAPVGYVTEEEGVIGLVGWLPEDAYPVYRGILAEGGALTLHFETSDPTTGYLRQLALGHGSKALVATSPGVAVQADWPERRHAMTYAMPL